MPRKARRRAWGSVTEVTRGKKYVLRWVENTPDGRKRKSRTVRGTYREACNELARIQVEKCEDRPMPTIGQAYEMWWLPWLERKYEGRMDCGTVDLYLRAWTNSCAPRWARLPVDQARPLEIQQWLSSLPQANAHSALTVMRRVLDFAVQYDLVRDNPFKRQYELPKQANARDKSVYSLEQASAMLEKIKGREFEAAFVLAAFGGVRTGESLGVKADELTEVEANGVRVVAVPICRRMAKAADYPTESLKTEQSERWAIVPEPYCDVLLRVASERTATGSEWLCDRGDGRPLNTGLLNSRWRTVAGSIPFANLRNSWRTFAQFEWRIDSDTLELLMGHTLPGVTGRHYLRPTLDMLVESFTACYVKNR